jgi:pimeloyl-ACP methyl ester carboxylesterase
LASQKSGGADAFGSGAAMPPGHSATHRSDIHFPDGRRIACLRRPPAQLAAQLAGELTQDGKGIVFLSGFRSDMSGTKATFLDAHCAARGRACLRFDYSGHGQSTGAFETGTIGRWAAEAVAAIDAAGDGPVILVGSSMGGWIMLLAALARPDRVSGLIGIAAAPDFTETLIWNRLPDVARDRLLAEGRLEEPSQYSDEPTIITRALIEEGRRHLLLSAPIGLRCPVRLLHGMADPDVPYQVSLELAARLAGDDVRVTLIKDGDHRLSRDSDLALLAQAVDELA